MKSNKGFTLIELLAVIVILAIIALIATPIVLDVIDTAKKGAKESSALGYINAVENQVMFNQVDDTKAPIKAGSYTVATLKLLGVQAKGEIPKDESTLTINEKGMVTDTQFEFRDGYYTTYNSAKGEATATKDSTTPIEAASLCSYSTGDTAVSCPVAGV